MIQSMKLRGALMVLFSHQFPLAGHTEPSLLKITFGGMGLLNALWKLLTGSGTGSDLARGVAGNTLKKWL